MPSATTTPPEQRSSASSPAAGGSRNLASRLATIMDAFDAAEPVLSLAELSRRVDLPKSTTHRLAEQLTAIGWLERDYRGYRVGLRVLEIGGLALDGNQLRDSAVAHLHGLARHTGLTVQLAILDRGEVVYLDRVVVGGYRLPTRQGGRMPAYCTGLGKAMLAFDDQAVAEVVRSGLSPRTAHTLSTPARLEADLERVRATGVAFDVQESFDGLACVAAPIRRSGRAIGAVSVSGPIDQIDLRGLPNVVGRTAADIWSSRFGPAHRHESNWARTEPRPSNLAS